MTDKFIKALVKQSVEDYFGSKYYDANKEEIVTNIAAEDLTYYLQYVWNSYSAEQFQQQLDNFLTVEGLKAKKFVDDWLGPWVERWRTRVKLIFKTDPVTRDSSQVTNLLITPFSPFNQLFFGRNYERDNILRFKWFTVTELLLVGEVVCLDMLARGIIRKVVRTANSVALESNEEMENRIKAEVKALSKHDENTIFIIVPMDIFKEEKK